MKHLLKMSDLSKNEIEELLTHAAKLKDERKKGIPHKLLEGKKLGMIFQKSSTRTRVSFEVGMYELGGHPLFLNANDLQIGRGEPVEDTARVLSRYLDGIMIRTFAQKEVEDFAKFGSVPVINGLTDYAHPCQVLADLMTIKEYKGTLEGKKLCYIGDGNNMANSLIVGGLTMGMEVSAACPAGYEPHKDVLVFAQDMASKGAKFKLTNNLLEAAEDADAVFTDVYASMGMEKNSELRQKVFKGFQVNSAIMSVTKKDCIVQHCLPAHRGEEITAEVFEAHAKEIFDEAENRLHVQKAVMVMLMG